MKKELILCVIMLTEYQQQLRDKVLAAPEMPAPEPWRQVRTSFGSRYISIGGLLGIGFAVDPDTGADLVMVLSSSGYGVFHGATGERLARECTEDWDFPDRYDFTCPGIGPLSEFFVPIAGHYGGGLPADTEDGWRTQTISPEWPHHRVLLLRGGDIASGAAGENWWHIFHAYYSEFRAAGFSPSGRTLAVATSSDLNLWTRSD